MNIQSGDSWIVRREYDLSARIQSLCSLPAVEETRYQDFDKFTSAQEMGLHSPTNYSSVTLVHHGYRPQKARAYYTGSVAALALGAASATAYLLGAQTPLMAAGALLGLASGVELAKTGLSYSAGPRQLSSRSL